MATKIKKPATTKAVTPAQQPAKSQADPVVSIHGLSGDDIVGMMKRRVEAATSFWNGKDFKLESTSKENEKWYLGKQVSEGDDGEDENLTLDNRIFTSIRTVVPYVTSRITEPEVYPSSNSVEAKKFAEDFEKALYVKAQLEKSDAKIRFAVEDGIIKRRGFLKPRYDGPSQNFCAIEYMPCESVIVDHKAKAYEEPSFVRFLLDKSVEDLTVMFPDMENKILTVFKLNKKSPKADMEKTHTVFEDWMFVKTDDGLDLIVSWTYKEVCFGAVQDPNWRYGKSNFFSSHMMPLIPVNVLSNGRTWIDKTSYVEQAKYLQNTVNMRGKQIGENAGLGSVGMPVVASDALAEDQSQYLTYESDTVLELDVPEGKGINDVFTTWKAGALSADVYNDKTDATTAIQNTFGASNVSQGQESNNKTLGQDELLRDQSQGRQQEIVTAIDNTTNRLYLFIAQFMLVYGDDEEMFKLVGENGEFDCIIMKSDNLDTDCEIRVKGGTSMPIDKTQRRATADRAASQKMIDPLSYWEIMDQPNAQKYSKRLMDFMADPKSFLSDVDDEVFDRDAFVDIQKLKDGEVPEYRDDLSKEYFDYLNKYILSGDLENPKITPEVKQSIMDFIDIQLARGQKMMGMLETQLPTAQDVATHNAAVDDANAADSGAQPAPSPEDPNAEASPAESAIQPTPQPVQ